MNLQEWQGIYPSAIVQTVPTEDPDFLSIFVENKFLWIPKKALSKTEEKLVQALTKAQQPEISAKEHPWYPALFQGKSAPSKDGRFRIIQVEFTALSSTSIEDWNNEIKSMLPSLVDYFFFSDSTCLLIETANEHALSPEELEGLFLALDGDLDMYTRLFVGSFYHYNYNFTQLLQEERQLFQQASLENNQVKCFDLSQSIIHYFSSTSVKDSYLMQVLYESWFDNDIPEIIESLWNNQGNVSSAAKDLFMHRNTLQYKIEKFQIQNLTNLKKMNDLFLCYLLVAVFHTN
ncbi:helix-turn-helix domain-containing protein [Enterococcus olivae]